MKVMLTGVTGFVGSSLAARFLMEGHKVLAISRNDYSGERTLKAVKEACKGFKIDLDPSSLDHLEVLSIDYSDLATFENADTIKDVDEVWHIAAEMAYSPSKFQNAFQQNLTVSGDLHEIMNRKAPKCRRFYYVSTCYTAGFNKLHAKEEVHLKPRFVNVYQASKWAAETNLVNQSHALNLPVTIFRPSIIVGHHRTGWNGNNDFGLYTFINAVTFGLKSGSKTLTLDLDGSAQLNFIPVDFVVDYAVKLSQRKKQPKELEIFNAAANTTITTGACMCITEKLLNATINIGKPVSMLDKLVDRASRLNRDFARTSWHFEISKLKKALGKDFVPFDANKEVLTRILDVYIKKKNAESLFPTTEVESYSSFRKGLRKNFDKCLNTAHLLGLSVRKVEPTITMKDIVSQQIKKGAAINS